MLNYARGFTLIEALIVLALLSLLIGMGAPALTHLLQSQQLRTASQNLASSFTLARQASITQRRPALIDNIDGRWENGWRVFVDANSNGIFDSGEHELQRYGPLPAGIRVAANSPVRLYIRYTPTGQAKLRSGAFQAGTLTLCHENGQHAVRHLILSATGRLRREKGAAGPC